VRQNGAEARDYEFNDFLQFDAVDHPEQISYVWRTKSDSNSYPQIPVIVAILTRAHVVLWIFLFVLNFAYPDFLQVYVLGSSPREADFGILQPTNLSLSPLRARKATHKPLVVRAAYR